MAKRRRGPGGGAPRRSTWRTIEEAASDLGLDVEPFSRDPEETPSAPLTTRSGTAVADAVPEHQALTTVASVLAQLDALHRRRLSTLASLGSQERRLVLQALDAGASWSQIARALDQSVAGVHKRHGPGTVTNGTSVHRAPSGVTR